MAMRLDSRQAQLAFPILFLFLAALFALVSRGAELERSAASMGAAPGGGCTVAVDAEGTSFRSAEALPILGGRRVRVIYVRGVVEPLERNFFGRPERVAIVSVSEDGFLIQNSVEDVSEGGNLKNHIGDDVTVRGTILVRTDGSATLLVDAFEVNESAPTSAAPGH